MVLTFPYHGGAHELLDESLNSLLKSLSLDNDHKRPTLRSVSFNSRETKPVLKTWGSGKLIIKGSLSFNSRNRDMDSFNGEPRIYKKCQASPLNGEANYRNTRFAPAEKSRELSSPKHEAAVKLQKVYKSFRTRRQLADCAVLVEQRWWRLLDFAMLRRSSVSFFEIEKNESVVSKWARAKSRAAKVGKGLSKDEKAKKLALQHWLEAIDPRHRYGHNLHFYYARWLRCECKQPFFYWLDVGEGKEISIDEKCPRSKLQHQCIKYLGPKEREEYEVLIEDRKLLYKKSRQILDTTDNSSDSKWIFVLSTTKNLYVGQKKKGTFQHSSFLAGGATSAAGRLEVEKGILKAIWPHSGHYRPTEENFQEFVAFLQLKNIDLTNVKKSPVEGEEEEEGATFALRRPSLSDLDLTRMTTEEGEEHESNGSNGLRTNSLKRSKSFDIPSDSAKARSEEEERARKKEMLLSVDSEESEEEVDTKTKDSHPFDSKQEEKQTLDGFRRPILFIGEQEEGEGTRLIRRRTNFRKENLSLQLGNQLTCRWTTGAGPRIGCVRDSPSELRFRALEEVSLSPRSRLHSRTSSSPANTPGPMPMLEIRHAKSMDEP